MITPTLDQIRREHLHPLTAEVDHCGSGPKGIRTPDLLAASQNRASGVLTCINAGRE